MGGAVGSPSALAWSVLLECNLVMEAEIEANAVATGPHGRSLSNS